ncbi:MAG: hypothetical protein Q9160_005087 [Pyrenula sp. 1 TL-2023]
MQEHVWLLFFVVDLSSAYPAIGNLHPKRLPGNSGWVLPSDYLTSGGSAASSIATQYHAAGSVASVTSSSSLPAGTAPRNSPFHGPTVVTPTSNYLFTPALSSGPNSGITSNIPPSLLPIYPLANGPSSVSFADSGALGSGSAAISHGTSGAIDAGSSNNGFYGTGSPGTGSINTGFSGTGSPTTSSIHTGSLGTGSPGTGLPGAASSATALPGTGFRGTGSPGSGTDSFPTGIPIGVSLPGVSSTSSSGTVTLGPLPVGPDGSLSTQATSIEGVTANTEITTTDKNGHHTIVPFLFGCWFCGGKGILLWGIGPGPGVYPPPSPPPFPSWPAITIGNDHIPTVEPKKDEPTKNSPTDNSPDKDEPTKTSSTSTTSTSSSSSCTSSTVTDYWVLCNSAAANTTSSCSTYSSSIITGCSVTAATVTDVACDADDPESADDLEEEDSDLESTSSDPPVTQTPGQPSSPSAVSGIPGIVGPSPGSAPTSGPTNTAQPAPVVPNPGVSQTSTAVTTTSAPPLCAPFQDPHANDRGHCQCSSGSFTTTLPFRTPDGSKSAEVCEYTTLVIPSSTTNDPPPTLSPNALPFTFTDVSKNVIACASSSTISLPGNRAATYCDGSSSTVSTGPPARLPTPSLSAGCGLWNEGWGWKFKIYDIGGWSTDGGKKLHDEEKGCGVLTGWSFKDNHASFNLPFFTKNGCVERAIASAGGPKIRCKHNGFGKRAVGVAVVRKRTDVGPPPLGSPPDFSNATIANAYRPPGVDINAISHTYRPPAWVHNARSVSGSRSIHKRLGCKPSKPAPPSIPPLPASECGPIIPGVDTCLRKIREHGKVCAEHAIFYSGFKDGNGGHYARKWAITKFGADALHNVEIVDDTKLVDPNWLNEVQNGIRNGFRPDGRTNNGMSPKQVEDLHKRPLPFMQNLSQAYAETCNQNAIVVVPQGEFANNEWNPDTTWGGWEYPSLTQHNVVRISRVDLRVTELKYKVNPADFSETPQLDFMVTTPLREIWNRAKDERANYTPKGIREDTLPVDLPPDKVPRCWSENGHQHR